MVKKILMIKVIVVDPNVVPYDFHFPMCMPLCSFFSLSVGLTCDLLLTDRIKQRYWDVTPGIPLCSTTFLFNRRLTLLVGQMK